jgi:signal peptidase II
LTRGSDHLLPMLDRRTSPRLVYVLIIIIVLILDHATKWAAAAWLSHRQAVTALDGVILLFYAKNPGAFLSLGASLGPEYRFWLFTIGIAVILLAITAFLFGRRPASLADGVLMSLILGGGLSNWIDRIADHGLVLDFLNVGIGSFRTGIFNLADFVLTLSVIGLAGRELFLRQAKAGRDHD